MNRKMGQIAQISCFLHNTKNIMCIASWNRNSSGETIKTGRNLLEISAQFLNVGSLLAKSLGICLILNHELLPSAGVGAARTCDRTLTLPCQKCWVILRCSLGKLETHFCPSLCWLQHSLLIGAESIPSFPYFIENETRQSVQNIICEICSTSRLTECRHDVTESKFQIAEFRYWVFSKMSF